jgi:hypothetical protein
VEGRQRPGRLGSACGSCVLVRRSVRACPTGVQRRPNTTPQRVGVATGPTSSEEARGARPGPGRLDLLAGQRWEAGLAMGRLHIRAHLRWEPRWTPQLLVMAGARRPLRTPEADHRAPLQAGGILVLARRTWRATPPRGRRPSAQAAGAPYTSYRHQPGTRW